MKSARALALVSSLTATACSATPADDAQTSDDNALTEAPAPRKGSSIASPSVDPTKMYWGARSIASLGEVGYLTPEEASVARRADGILANSPPNGNIGVDELAVLESPDHVNTLFPEERAVIPKLWKILLINDVPAYTPAAVTIPTVVHDSYPTAPFQLPIATLTPPYYQTLAKRIQLTQNSDGNPATVAGADVEKAYADKSSYLPDEVKAFRELARQIAAAAPPLPIDAQWIDIPDTSTQVLLDIPPVKLTATVTPNIAGQWAGGNPTAVPLVLANGEVRVGSADAGTRLIVLDKTLGGDYLPAASAPPSGIATSSRVEVWRAGARVAEFDAAPAGKASAPIPFGYAVRIGPRKLVMVCRPSRSVSTSGVCAYEEQTATPAPAPMMAPTSYYVAQHPDYRLDVFQNGRALLVGPGSVATCYPKPTQFNQSGPAGCTVYAGDAAVVDITYGNSSSNDTPFTATGSFTVPSLGPQGLYPY